MRDYCPEGLTGLDSSGFEAVIGHACLRLILTFPPRPSVHSDRPRPSPPHSTPGGANTSRELAHGSGPLPERRGGPGQGNVGPRLQSREEEPQADRPPAAQRRHADPRSPRRQESACVTPYSSLAATLQVGPRMRQASPPAPPPGPASAVRLAPRVAG